MKPALFESFGKSQLASLLATAIDYLILFTLVEFFGVWYVTATAIGAFVGALTHFTLSRYWCFRVWEKNWPPQAFRYSMVSAGSLIFNSYGVYWMTESIRMHYSFSVFFVSIFVAVFFNFPLHRYFVFR